MGALFRWGLLLAGLGCAAIAWGFWTGGTPPLWSFMAERAQTVVIWAELSEEPGPAGGARRVPHVHIAWPPGSQSSVELPGLQSPHRRWHLHHAGEIVRDHPVGSRITIRVVDGRPYADRTDLHELAYALLASVFAVIFTVSGIALVVGRMRGEREEAAT